MSYKALMFHLNDNVAVISLHRPDRSNARSIEPLVDFPAALEAVAHSRNQHLAGMTADFADAVTALGDKASPYIQRQVR